jgi:hypothetical protein
VTITFTNNPAARNKWATIMANSRTYFIRKCQKEGSGVNVWATDAYFEWLKTEYRCSVIKDYVLGSIAGIEVDEQYQMILLMKFG